MTVGALRRKTQNDQETWMSAFDHVEAQVSRDHIDRLIDNTVTRIQRTVAGERAAFAWSGGKDSAALWHVCRLAGVTDGVLAMAHPDLEYVAFRDYVDQHKPPGVQVKINEAVNLNLLVEQPALLFPTNRVDMRKFWARLQWKLVPEFWFANGYEQMLLGRRRSDGNIVRQQVTTRKDGYKQNSPIFDWTHEEVMACIKYNDLPLPAIYGYPDGYKIGTGPWAKMLRSPARPTLHDCWAYVYAQDPAAVERAAAHPIGSAADYLDSRA